MINIIIYGRQKDIFNTYVNFRLHIPSLALFNVETKDKVFLKLLQDLQIPWNITYNIHIFSDIFSLHEPEMLLCFSTFPGFLK